MSILFNFELIFNNQDPDFFNEVNSIEIFDLDNDYTVIDNLYNEINTNNRHIYILNKLKLLNWELRRIYHSIIGYYQINFDHDQTYIDYITNSLKVLIKYLNLNLNYLEYYNLINNELINLENIENVDNNNLLKNVNELNKKKYFELDSDIKDKYTECIICYNKFDNDNDIVILNCNGNHIYCYNCIVYWLQNHTNKCPICK